MRRFAYDFERALVELEEKLDDLKKSPSVQNPEIAEEIAYLESQIEKLREKTYANLTPWQKVRIARHPDRPRTLDYVEHIFHDYLDLHGDRLYSDDPAIVGGFAFLDSQKVMIIGHQKGKNPKENVLRNFGMAHPEGYRKALRLMKLAEKFHLPLISFIDTPGAYPGIGAEERGQAGAIALNLFEMSALRTPIIVINIGEGGSGGALAIGVGDRIFMLENAYYSVITPEGCASILYNNASKAEEAAEALKLTAESLFELGLIDGIIPEPLGGAHRDPHFVSLKLKETLSSTIKELVNIPLEHLVEERYQRLRKIGFYREE